MANNTYQRASSMLQKAKGPKWKRELVSDHKFDFMDVEAFRETTCLLSIRYLILLCSVVVSTLVYGADLWSAGILLIYDHWSLSTQPKIPFYISKWIYVGCIVISFMLLAWEIRKTRTVMETRDISLAVTNPLAYRTYSIKSYSHFCLLQKIKSSTKWSDVIIFYVFYTLKTWKRVIIAQGPRQIIAGVTVYALLKSAWTAENGSFQFSADWDTYGQDWPQRVALFLMSFTCILWVISAIQIVLAVFLYFPILCQIQGNLKEYCCHKIDKRIDELLEKQRKKRLREREKYSNSISSKKSKSKSQKKNNKQPIDETIPALPTLPNVALYAGEKTDASWLYQQPQQQHSFGNYYDSQPMTPLESSYSLTRNPTKYSPYNDASYQSQMYQPAGAYTQESTNDYYYSQQYQQQYSNTINAPTGTTPATTSYNKPHEYNDGIDTSVYNNKVIYSNAINPGDSTYNSSEQKESFNKGLNDPHLPTQEDMHDDAFNSNASHAYHNNDNNYTEAVKKPAIHPSTYSNYI